MRTRTIILLAALIVVCFTAANFLSDLGTAFSALPETRVEQARREALAKPFHQRKHRLERRARLEQGIATSSPPRSVVSSHIAAVPLETTAEVATAPLEAAESVASESVVKIRRTSGRARAKARKSKPQIPSKDAEDRAKYHVIPSVDGSTYTEWQIRVCYYWYKKVKQQNPDSAMGGFTRLLHSGQADNLMDEIPTAVVDPLPPGVDEGYVVLNRPHAFWQWVVRFMPSIPEDYIFMAEPDHLFVRPVPLWATPTRAAAYPFTYIQPMENAELVNRFNDKNLSTSAMAPIGNAPVQIHRRHLEAIVKPWRDLSIRMKRDAEVSKAFGWILEMYAFSIASSQKEGGPLEFDLHAEMMGQPPFDPHLVIQGKPISIIHLTYGMDYQEDGKMIYGKRGQHFHWDKRDYDSTYPPRNLPQPPDNVDAPAVRFLLSAINEASASLPWPS